MHKDLVIYQLAIDLALEVYRAAAEFPAGQGDGLADSMRHAALSAPSRISEGAARDSKNEAINFLYLSLKSLAELETQVEVAHGLGFMADNKKINEMVATLHDKLIASVNALKA